MNVKRFDSSEGDVWKYVFEFDNAVAEAVLYRYESFKKRTVLCVSVQSGCPVGCKFCGTGKQFIRNLNAFEIIYQVEYCLQDMVLVETGGSISSIERLQIMFMSMGEPMLNHVELFEAVRQLDFAYYKPELLISTMGPKTKMKAYHKLLALSETLSTVGLQFSVHEAFEHKRNKLIPYSNKLSLCEMRDYGIEWSVRTERPVYINYCVTEHNHSQGELDRLKDLFPARFFYFTFSVVCSSDETMKEAGFREMETIQRVSNYFLKDGYNVRVFDPAGQDDIGGGCGQLWYVQEWMKNNIKG